MSTESLLYLIIVMLCSIQLTVIIGNNRRQKYNHAPEPDIDPYPDLDEFEAMFNEIEATVDRIGALVDSINNSLEGVEDIEDLEGETQPESVFNPLKMEGFFELEQAEQVRLLGPNPGEHEGFFDLSSELRIRLLGMKKA